MVLGVLLACDVAPAQNKVLELDGFGSYVELPPNIFTNLTEATVEVWARWDSFRAYSRIFEFGAAWQSMNLFNHDRTPDLRFNLYPQNAKLDRSLMHHIRVNGLLTANEWIHLAAVSGPGGMKLYANGALVGEHTNAASFADIHVSHTNVFGRGLTRNPGDQDFRGQMDEIRVWNHRRSEAQIRENMHKRLTGKEEGLAGLWNFDDGTANDASPHAYRGKLVGNARVVTADSPADAPLFASEPLKATQHRPPVLPATGPANVPANNQNAAAWWIAGALTLIVALLTWLVLMLRRSGVGETRLLPPSPARALLTEGRPAPATIDPVASQELKERALADLTEFAKQSLVQGLYAQRNALLETQQQAQRELAELEARIVSLQLPDRIQAYEKRIADLERELETRSGEVRELTNATLLLLRRKLEKLDEEKQRDSWERFN
ncbi:MAG TPA: LamG-like jellyroll fold domain-containing protein [Verrucomicrobiae bacterium]|nr:LamG-like jellyroll fold domain-containing protein [Verrucomicrobiae bacterium]